MILSACNSFTGKKKLFKKLPTSFTRVTFQNTLTETDTFNYFLFPYMYMGGGVSVADFNNDGLTDIYFTGNMVSNRLYLNQGNLKFKDVTEISQTGGDGRWMLGSTVCDINDDGLPDIYISVSGVTDMCRNMLFVNQGNNHVGIPVFIEEAAKYGIDDNGKSTHSTFFDFDNDGDLDLYVANYPITHFQMTPYFYRQMMRNAQHSKSSHLYRNEGNGKFTDVTEQAGLLNFGLTLSATVSDLNQDGYKDLYVSNDFTSPDFFYMNNGNGTFTDRCLEMASQTSFYGMGADIADINNDGLQDILQIDMAPEDNQRAKENMTSMPLADFEEMIQQGLNFQYRYSTLQLNRGIHKNGLPHFSNTAWIAGVTSTDWSWGALFADFDLDGWKDLYITNGSRRDINNIDFFNEIEETADQKTIKGKDRNLYFLKKMPYKPLTNYLYRNNHDLTFSQVNQEWNITETSYSNGMAYADLDNDGDLELIVNNIDAEAFIYNNNALEQSLGNYLKISFEGTNKNKMGIGSEVTLWTEGKMQCAELTLSRGYQSSVEPILYFGLAQNEEIDSLLIKWPDGKNQLLLNVSVNQKLVVKHTDALPAVPRSVKQMPLFDEVTNQGHPVFVHRENAFNDYQKQVLLPHKMSMLGPAIAVGDINNDSFEDFFIGNAAKSPAALFTQQKNGTFVNHSGPWEKDIETDVTGALFFDADGDEDLDLYVVSGGYEFPAGSTEYADRLYINDGKGNFHKDENGLPRIYSSGSCVKPIDFDKDGDLDLFVGGRQIPWKYPYPADSYILENKSADGQVRFEDITSKVAPDLKEIGMVTSAVCMDINRDEWPDLVVAGEWMPICYFINHNGKFKKNILEGTRGLWFSVEGADMDGDGDIDFVAGNLGLNFRYQAKPGNTFDVYAGDFNNNGGSDIVLSYYQKEKQYPLRGRSCFVSQNPWIAIKFPTYAEFGAATVSDIFTNDLLEKSLHLQAETFASYYFENTGDGKFIPHPLPNEAQLSSTNGIILEDFDRDGKQDILAAGNLFNVEVATPRNDAGVGTFLKGDGKGNFSTVAPALSGFFVPGDVKALSLIRLNDNESKSAVLVGNNNSEIQIFQIK
ncbi:MAG: VCBS repeat-containing protein [Bacteroidales bacterium]|nr:VCBS repeat-containing protein [Bacteroidales bacterium]